QRMKHALLLSALIATQANAQIIYTDVIPDASYSGANDSCYLDLDNNGEVDYLIIRREDPYYCFSCLQEQPQLRVLIYPMATNTIGYLTWISQHFPECYQSGQVIDANLGYSPTNGLMRDASPGGGCPPHLVACAPWPSFTWSNFPEGYLGLRFTIAGETHYGWARLSIPSAAGFTLKDYAYNSVPGEGILAGQTQCSTPFALAVNDVDSNSVDLTWVSFGADTFNLRYRPTGTVIWSEIDTITTTNLTVAGLADCTEYEYQVAAACNGGSTAWSDTFSLTTLGCGACLDISYCPSAGNSAADQWIAGVQVGTLDHQSGSDNGYGNHTAFGTELEIGAVHPITLTPGYNGSPWSEYFKVFLDLDHDGDFDDAGELAYNAGSLTQGPISGTLDIPVGALAGRTRMRVIMRYGNVGAVGCSNGYPYGETEDYCVDLVDNLNGVGESPAYGQLHLSPNPFTSTLSVSLGMNKTGVATCTVRALTGQALVTRTVTPTSGPSSITLDLGSLAPGTYLLEMQTGGERIVRKVVKE
ncbi:MAG: T9SS type A sorting domain-containing protein, partial [Flavobacteriales bacterium]|nr:T9SS type A sorting domain-containing protein [Flavobacteriales bacterium]